MPIRLKLDLSPKIQFMDINARKLVATKFAGDNPSVYKGRGTIFDSYREYSTGDDSNLIDWKASGRAGRTMIRQYVEERNLDVFFLLDASHTMVSGSQKKLKHEFAAEIVASMSYVILDHGNSVGVGLFSDTVRGFLSPERGVAQYQRIASELSNSDHYDRHCDFGEAVKFCINRLRPQTMVILLTDGISLRGDWESLLRVANNKFELLVMLVRDPLDDELPAGAGNVAVEDPLSGRQILMDTDKIRGDYMKIAREIKERTLSILRRAGISDVPIIRTDQDFAREVVKFFEKQKRK